MAGVTGGLVDDEFLRKLGDALDHFDDPETVLLCEDFARQLRCAQYRVAQCTTAEVLKRLRRKRKHSQLQVIANACLSYQSPVEFMVRRHYAQSLIENGNIQAAFGVLNELLTLIQNNTAEGEYAEAQGLIGRAYKQLYVDAVMSGGRGRPEHLHNAIFAYLKVYANYPTYHLWHGINAVALLKRAQRDGVPVGIFPNPNAIAEDVLAEIERRYRKDSIAIKAGRQRYQPQAGVWDYATAMEACIALGRNEEALEWLFRYVEACKEPGGAKAADAFELNSTLRQLTEVWQLSVDQEPGTRILPILRAHLLRREGAAVTLTSKEVIKDTQKDVREKVQEAHHRFASRQVASEESDRDDRFSQHGDCEGHEKVFGDDRYETYEWYLTGARRCRLVARIGRDDSRGFGTGFLIQGALLNPAWKGLVLLTNAHVVSDVPTALHPKKAHVTFDALKSVSPRGVQELLWSSPSTDLDATVLRLENSDELERELAEDALKFAPTLPALNSQPPARLYVIGHPGGGTLSLSLQDNVLLDYEKPRIHYRTPTEGGSSGSPVFDRDWDLIGLHHAGRRDMPRLRGQPGVYQANEGIWISAIAERIKQGTPR